MMVIPRTLLVLAIVPPILGFGLTDTVHPCGIGQLRIALRSISFPELCGEEIDVESIREMPQFISFPDAESDKTYVLIMVDPYKTSTSRPKYWINWLLASIPGGELQRSWLDLQSGTYTTLYGYDASTPKEGGGIRYIIYVYEQPENTLSNVPWFRHSFSLDDFASANELDSPVAGFEFITQSM